MNADTPLSAQVAAALGGLGTTADGIAATLENKGITAMRRDPHSCALSAYVREQFPECDFVSTGAVEMHVGTPSILAFESFALTGPQQAFVAAFDDGRFPNLVLS